MPTSLELRTQRAAMIAQARTLVDKAGVEKRDLNGEENAQFDKLMVDADKLLKEAEGVERRERLDLSEAELRQSQGRRIAPDANPNGAPTNDEIAESVRAWALAATDRARTDADTIHRAARCGIQLAARNLSVRSLSKGTTTAGGHTVPVDMAAAIEIAMKFFAPIRGIARVLPTTTGADLDYPRTTDVANSAGIVAEAGTIAANVDPTFDKVTFKAWKYATTIVKVSIELLQDSSVNIPALLGAMLGERMGRGQATHHVIGTSTTQPQGLAVGSTRGVALANTNVYTFDKVIDLIYSVDRAYRAGANFLTHDESMAALVKLKDSDGQYLWRPSLLEGEPDRLLSYPVVISNDITSITTPGDDAALLLFGNMAKNYMIRDVAGSRQVTRLDELYAATGEVGFVMIERSDARYIGHSGCVKSLNSYDAP
ncbi:MAG: phage major capsid protein [Ardenticatenales bacterium]